VSATSLSTRTKRPQGLRIATRAGAVRALVQRDWRITRSYRTALITDLAFGFLNLAAYFYISRTLKANIRHGLDGAPSYFAFAAVGVALSVVLQAAVSGVSRRIREEQLTGTLEALLVQPISSVQLALGLAGFPFLFAVVRAFLYLLLAGAFLGLSFAHCDWLGLVVSFVVSGAAFAALGVGLAAVVLVFKRADAVGAVGTFALSLLGGAFFPTRVLPPWLHALSAVAPTRYAFDAVRGALFGRQDWLAPTLELAAVGAVSLLVAFALFSAALRHAVRRGTINQY
jgi:ABC-2 type transport system permease protein